MGKIVLVAGDRNILTCFIHVQNVSVVKECNIRDHFAHFYHGLCSEGFRVLTHEVRGQGDKEGALREKRVSKKGSSRKIKWVKS